MAGRRAVESSVAAMRGASRSECWPGFTVRAGPCSGFERQSHRLSGSHRALDCDSGLEVHACLLRCRVDGGGAGDEMIEPGARFVAERTPEITNRPVAGGIAAEKCHLQIVPRDIGMRDALLGKQQV